MPRTFRSLNKPARFVMTTLCLAAGLSTYGAMAMPPVLAVSTAALPAAAAVVSVLPATVGSSGLPAVSATVVANYQAACAGIGTSTESVPICQQPLTIQPSVPPNIVLMLDDSGSMAWDYMPDWDYLQNHGNNDAVIDASNNGVYYNPTVAYLAPPNADGTFMSTYTDPSNVPVDGFRSVANVNVYTFNGSDYNGNGNTINYNTSNVQQITTVNTVDDWHSRDSYCSQEYSSTSGSFGGYTYTSHSGTWYLNGVRESGGGECQFSYKTTQNQTFNYFQYSTGPAAGSYTVYYVAPASQGCGASPPGTCVVDSASSGLKDASGNSITVGQNVANWLAYYHTRILMAKTGLMRAFISLNSAYRFGFGSINANGIAAIPSPTFQFDDYILGGGSSTNKLAEVQPFGNGASGTQKAKFWNWITNESASGNTPLRKALMGAGNYYSDKGAQAWSMMSSDPTYKVGGTNDTVIACRQAYTILTTDGFWNGTPPSVGDVDDTVGPKITGPSSQSFTYNPVQPFSDKVFSPPSYYDADCSSRSATLDSTNGYCDWVQSRYRLSKKGSYQYSYTGCPANAYAGSCTPSYKTGSYNGCSSGDGWDPSKGSGGQCLKAGSSGTGNSDTLADVAMYFWNHDLQTGIPNEVPTNDEDPGFWQHMVTFTMGLGFTPTNIQPADTTTDQIFKWSQSGGGTTTDQSGKTVSPSNSNAISSFSWPTPSSNNINNIADLEHAGVNGHGGFFSATNPQTFISGLQEALRRAAVLDGTGASLAANSTQLKTGTVAYQAIYHTVVWTGDLQAFAVVQSDGSIGAQQWGGVGAASVLIASATKDATTGVLTYPKRDIMTYNPSAAVGAQFVAFQNASTTSPPSLSSAELAALGSTSAQQVAMVNYLRGDTTNEGSNGSKAYRSRSTDNGTPSVPLGDIADSQPVYSGAPDPNEFVGQSFTGSSTFAAFASTQASITPLIFVAGNDGMLHGFDAGTGLESFAYLPAAVITAGLANLANPAYGSDADPHQYYNDGQLTIADAYFAEGSDAAAWHTILVGTTGRGSAKAVYALDVTNPTGIKFLWERSAGDGISGSDYIGQMTGKPVIAQTSTDSTQGSMWSVLIGNGYNSTNNQAALLQFDLATGKLNVHTTSSNASANGLAAPVSWIGTAANGLSTDAYAGDLLGQVWDFPLMQTTCDNTKTPPVCTTSATPTSAGVKLFTAEDASGNAQPITAGMLAGKDPDSGNVWLYFGTGKYLQYADLRSTQVQSWYGLIVQTGTNNPSLPALPITTNSLGTDGSTHLMVQRYITDQTDATSVTVTNADGSTTTTNTLAARTVTPQPAVNDMGGARGWYLNLQTPTVSADGKTTTYASQGEMMVDPDQFQTNLLLGTTRIPVVTDICNPSGSGWIMALNPFTGTAPSSDFFDLNGDGAINGQDEVNGQPAAGAGFNSMPNAPIFVGGDMLTSFQNGKIAHTNTAGGTGKFRRVSWREVINQ